MAYILDLSRAQVSDPMVPQLTIHDPSKPFRQLFDNQMLQEGRLPPDSAMPNQIYMRGKSKKFPDLIPVNADFYVVSERGRKFFDLFAEQDVRFIPVSIYSTKLKATVEQPYYWFIFHTACDSIDFQQSELDVVWFDPFYPSGSNVPGEPRWGIQWRGKPHHGLVSRVADRKGAQIWREVMKCSNYAYAIFVSDELAKSIKTEKICRSPDLIPVKDI